MTDNKSSQDSNSTEQNSKEEIESYFKANPHLSKRVEVVKREIDNNIKTVEDRDNIVKSNDNVKSTVDKVFKELDRHPWLKKAFLHRVKRDAKKRAKKMGVEVPENFTVTSEDLDKHHQEMVGNTNDRNTKV